MEYEPKEEMYTNERGQITISEFKMAQCLLNSKQKELLLSLVPGLQDGTVTLQWTIVGEIDRIMRINGLPGELWNSVWRQTVLWADIEKFVRCGFLIERDLPGVYIVDDSAILEAAKNNFEVPMQIPSRQNNERDPRRVFVVHGRNQKVRKAMFAFLRSIKLDPNEWSEAVADQQKGSPYTGDIVDKAISVAQAIVVLLTPEDIVRLHPIFHEPGDPIAETGPILQPRPNVLYEAGMAMAYAPNRTIFVEFGSIRRPSDIAGMNIVKFADNPRFRKDLAQRLSTIGCTVNQTGSDWLTEGAFGDIDLGTDAPVDFSNRIGRWQVRDEPPNDERDHLTGDAGRPVGADEWEITTPDPLGKGVYGPYIRLKPNTYQVTFRVKINDNRGNDGRLATLDATSRRAHKHFAQRTLTVGDFESSDVYQDFHLIFDVLNTEEDFEFRVRTDPKFGEKKRLTIAYVELGTD